MAFNVDINNHEQIASQLFEIDKKRRQQAEKQANNRILSKNDVQGLWDANRVLHTTLGGEYRELSAEDLAAFRRNMKTAKRNFQGNGITARQVINLAAGRSLNYAKNEYNKKHGYNSDIDKAKKQIKYAVIASAQNNILRFITNASGETPGIKQHHVIIKFTEFDSTIARLSASEINDKNAAAKEAKILRKTKLAFDCDCGRHTYFFRYVATIGGFNAGRPETGYPKIRNPGLKGVACKHVLRVLTELESSGVILNYLTRHLEKLRKSHNNKAVLKVSQKQAQQQAKNKGKGKLQTDAERKAQTQKAREAAGIKRAAKQATSNKKSKNEKIIDELIKDKKLNADLLNFMRSKFTDAEIIKHFKTQK